MKTRTFRLDRLLKTIGILSGITAFILVPYYVGKNWNLLYVPSYTPTWLVGFLDLLAIVCGLCILVLIGILVKLLFNYLFPKNIKDDMEKFK
jgi:heme/copper-type cytochrome/quinol oxidase subunit 2